MVCCSMEMWRSCKGETMKKTQLQLKIIEKVLLWHYDSLKDLLAIMEGDKDAMIDAANEAREFKRRTE